MTRMRFNGSKSFRDSKVTIKNIGTVREIASFFIRNVLKRK